MNVGDPDVSVNVHLTGRELDIPLRVMISGKVKIEGAKGHCYKQGSLSFNRQIEVLNQYKVGANAFGELFKRRRNEMPDAERLKTLQEKL